MHLRKLVAKRAALAARAPPACGAALVERWRAAQLATLNKGVELASSALDEVVKRISERNAAIELLQCKLRNDDGVREGAGAVPRARASTRSGIWSV